MWTIYSLAANVENNILNIKTKNNASSTFHANVLSEVDSSHLYQNFIFGSALKMLREKTMNVSIRCSTIYLNEKTFSAIETRHRFLFGT